MGREAGILVQTAAGFQCDQGPFLGDSLVGITLFLIIAVWPVVGLAILTAIGRVGPRARRGGVLPPATSGAEVLARMYLWPLVLLRIYLGRRP
jgi:hypothetical protein